ncbi:MAG: VOC family protein [Candidatus Tectomicrobia bacterium]|uniref:VOC family protein n=1 Tax=Tectimicrobiota bacterium TaxID=2528274 RepID=A0A932MNP2_UNCTE|nr:VOC family protein [Candidatus Tectomicrobia bacterium]
MARPARPFEGIQHVAIKVSDIERSLRFYTEVLGFSVSEIRQPGEHPVLPDVGLCFIRCTGLHHDINLVFRRGRDPELEALPKIDQGTTKDLGIHHFALRVRDRAEFNGWEAWLRENGIAIVRGPVVHSPTHPEGDGTWGENRALYFCDPDGHRIEIFCEMAEMDPRTNGIDPRWYAERLRQDGQDPSRFPPAPPFRPVAP